MECVDISCARGVRCVYCRNAPNLVALALCSWSGALWVCISRISILAKDDTQEKDCQSFAPCARFSYCCMYRCVGVVRSPSSGIALFQYTVSMWCSTGIHSPTSGFGRYASRARNVYTRSLCFLGRRRRGSSGPRVPQTPGSRLGVLILPYVREWRVPTYTPAK